MKVGYDEVLRNSSADPSNSIEVAGKGPGLQSLI